MNNNISIQTMGIVREHWFKLCLLLLMIIAAFKKDLSFQVRMNTPQTEEKTKSNTEKETELGKDKVMEKSIHEARAGKTDEAVATLNLGSIFGGSDKAGNEFPAVDEQVKIAYMRRYAQVSVDEHKKFGIPASIILANAMRQSFAGKRDVTAKGNNHFGLVASTDWKGDRVASGGGSFRKYENAWVSFRDHSLFLTTGKNAGLKELGKDSYKSWAKAIQDNGYPGFGSGNGLALELIGIVEKYKLDRLDR
jgi:flagellum-specific peptidoglycan hydrolase FlgJ